MIEEGVNYGRVIAAIVLFSVGLIFLCCCAAGVILHDYFVDKRNQEIDKQELESII